MSTRIFCVQVYKKLTETKNIKENMGTTAYKYYIVRSIYLL